MIHEVVGTVVGRWYVGLYALAFVVFAVSHLGAKRFAIYTATAMALGAIAENSSVIVGFPYTKYTFNPHLRGAEVWLGQVPLMVPLSYTFTAYFAFGAARLLVAGPYRTRSGLPVLEYLVAVLLATWATWILDPVCRLGHYFYLGDLFHYDGPGFWFGLPLGSQIGFLCVNSLIIGVLTLMMRNERDVRVARLRNHPRLPALALYTAQVGAMPASLWVGAHLSGDLAGVQAADTLAGAGLIISIPMVLMTAVHWRSLRAVGDDERAHGVDPDPTVNPRQ
jgi:uncharacterized membrane protein